jgi:virginiamycin B lyase
VTVPVTLKGGRAICGVWTSWPLKKGSNPAYIVSGPDKALWFTEAGSGKIGRITTSGSVTNEYPIPTASSHPEGITVGPDGAVWFAEYSGQKVGRITTAGAMVEYPVDEEGYNGMSAGSIVFGKDSRIFVTGLLTSNYGDQGVLAAMNINGSYSSQTFTNIDDYPNQITRGPGGSSYLWFTSGYGIGRATLGGTVTELLLGQLPDPCPGPDYEGITAGPDGAIWYTDATCGVINRQPTNLTAGTTYQLSSWAAPWGITTGPDGALWFAESSGVPGTVVGKIGRITTDGIVTEYPTSKLDFTYGITLGPDGALWFTEYGDRIGRLQ